MADPVLGPVAVSDTYRVSLIQRLYGQRVLNVLYYDVTDVPDPSPDRWAYMNSLADALTGAGSIMAAMQAMQCIDLEWEAIRVNQVRLPDEAATPYAQIDAIDTGTLIEPAGTPNVALSIEKRSTFTPGHPQQGIGRIQIAGIPQDRYVAGFFTDAYLLLAAAVSAAILDEITTAGVTAVPTNFGWDYTPPNPKPTGFHTFPIFGANAKRTVRNMRRRTVGVGE